VPDTPGAAAGAGHGGGGVRPSRGGDILLEGRARQEHEQARGLVYRHAQACRRSPTLSTKAKSKKMRKALLVKKLLKKIKFARKETFYEQ